MKVDVACDADEMARRAATFICQSVCAPHSVGAVCLAGGETPRPVYELLTQAPFAARMPWPRIHWFFGDERFVPPTSPRSNYRMAKEALFSRAPIEDSHIHAMPTLGVDVRGAADLYEAVLRDFYAAADLLADRPLFDVVILGLGEDGHTASLLPGRHEVDERMRWVSPVPAGGAEPRITLTPPPLRSGQIVFLVAGAGKRSALQKLRAADQSIPASRLCSGRSARAFVDAQAGQ